MTPHEQSPPAAVPAPRRILAICTRRLGDVLLTTALLRSLRRAWPQAELDVLTLQAAAPALAGNPDVTRVIPLVERAGLRDSVRALGGPRRYDLALSTLYVDRPHWLALWAGRRRANLVPWGGVAGGWWKRPLSTHYAAMDSKYHAVVQYLRLADCLGIPRRYELVPPRATAPHDVVAALAGPYAVVHAAPLYVYKRWTLDGWRALVRWLSAQGLRVVLTGGPAETERRYVAELAEGLAVPGLTNLSGQLAFAQLTDLLERAAVYAGPDTSVTHLAAATGVPTVTPFGPTSPVLWGPWPTGIAGEIDSPWRAVAPAQQRGNVWIVQGLPHCVPCQREGCDNRLDSRADCLGELPASRMLAAAAAALSGEKTGSDLRSDPVSLRPQV